MYLNETWRRDRDAFSGTWETDSRLVFFLSLGLILIAYLYLFIPSHPPSLLNTLFEFELQSQSHGSSLTLWWSNSYHGLRSVLRIKLHNSVRSTNLSLEPWMPIDTSYACDCFTTTDLFQHEEQGLNLLLMAGLSYMFMSVMDNTLYETLLHAPIN